MNYPQGSRNNVQINRNNKENNHSYSNRGKTLEEEINVTNKFYLVNNIAIIHKKPTPIQIVNVHYPKRSAAVITEAYFQSRSTTDYNGIYKGKHIDFEAKETRNKTLFPLNNIHEHQFEHMKSIVQHGGICFFIIRFTYHDETYLLMAEEVFPYWKGKHINNKKSIPYKDIREKGHIIPFHYQKQVDYLSLIDRLYF